MVTCQHSSPSSIRLIAMGNRSKAWTGRARQNLKVRVLNCAWELSLCCRIDVGYGLLNQQGHEVPVVPLLVSKLAASATTYLLIMILTKYCLANLSCDRQNCSESRNLTLLPDLPVQYAEAYRAHCSLRVTKRSVSQATKPRDAVANK